MDWVAFCDFLRILPDSTQIRTVWHPLPRQAFMRLKNGKVAQAYKGAPAYELLTGEKVVL